MWHNLKVAVVSSLIVVPLVLGVPRLFETRNDQTWNGIEVKVIPRGGARLPVQEACWEDVVVDVKGNGEITINSQMVKKENLEETLRDVYYNRICKVIFIDSSPGVKLSYVVSIIDAALGAGVRRVLIITDDYRDENGYPPRTQ